MDLLASLLAIRPIVVESYGIKMLLAGIIRRAAFDIALYKDDPKLVNRRIAVGAYNWMFSDTEPTNYLDRFTSFLTLCEILDQDPEWIRSGTLRLDKRDVKKFDRVGMW